MNTLLFVGSAGAGALIGILYFVGIIFGIHLFIKVWRACNDIHRIANKLAPKEDGWE